MFGSLKRKWYKKRVVAYAYDAKERRDGSILVKHYFIVKELVNGGAKIVYVNRIKILEGNFGTYLSILESKKYKPLAHYIYCTDIFKKKI